jgi:aspartate aminotransferase-like enzyme
MEEGRAQVFARHTRVAQHCRDGVASLGLRPYADPRFASNTVTAFYTPEGVDSRDIAKQLEDDYDTVVAIGQGPTTTTTMRIGHLGFCTEGDIDAVIDALGKTLPTTAAR